MSATTEHRSSWLVRATLVTTLVAAAQRPATATSVETNRANRPGPLEIGGGLAAMLLQSYQFSAVDLAGHLEVQGPITAGWIWAAGGRLGLGPLRPEGFVRASAAPPFRFWRPAVGLELGLTGRTQYAEASGGVARTLREQAREDISPFYGAMHAAPLRFAVWRGYSISLLELQLGSHLGALGRDVRLQLGFLSVTRAL